MEVTRLRGLRPMTFWRELLPGFPVKWVTENPKIEGFFAKAVWLGVPLQYYVLTHFAGGIKQDAYVPTAMFSLISILMLILLSCVFALFSSLGNEIYSRRVRMWSIALIIGWSATLLLLALSYYIGVSASLNGEIAEHFLCRKLDCQGPFPSFQLPTIISYSIYSVLAVSLIGLIRYFQITWSKTKPNGPLTRASETAEPNMIVVACTVTILMTLMNSTFN
jgi:hypothetical protein